MFTRNYNGYTIPVNEHQPWSPPTIDHKRDYILGMFTHERFDNLAPGVRNQIPNPGMVKFPEMPFEFQNDHMPIYSYGNPLPFQFNNQMQALNAAWKKVLWENIGTKKIHLQDNGAWAMPDPGRSALSDFFL